MIFCQSVVWLPVWLFSSRFNPLNGLHPEAKVSTFSHSLFDSEQQSQQGKSLDFVRASLDRRIQICAARPTCLLSVLQISMRKHKAAPADQLELMWSCYSPCGSDVQLRFSGGSLIWQDAATMGPSLHI